MIVQQGLRGICELDVNGCCTSGTSSTCRFGFDADSPANGRTSHIILRFATSHSHPFSHHRVSCCRVSQVTDVFGFESPLSYAFSIAVLGLSLGCLLNIFPLTLEQYLKFTMLAATRVWTSEKLVQSRPCTSNVLRSAISIRSKCDHRSFSSALGSPTLSEHRSTRGSITTLPASLSRNVSWENRSRVAFRRAMKGFNQPTDSSKFISVEQVKTWVGDLAGARPGSGIEDVERSAIDHLLRGDDKANIRKATLTNGHHFAGLRPNEKASGNEDVGFIDPITNRRVHKATKTAPKPRYGDLEAYKPIDFVKATAEADSTPKYDDLDKYKPAKDVKKPEPAEPKYDDLGKYKPEIDETSTKEKPVEYDDLDQYGPVKYNEPDGQQKPTTEEDSKKYKDLDKYSSANVDSPLAQPQLTADEKSKAYQDLNQYKPVYWNEPDGLKAQSAEELSKDYDDLGKYKAVYWNEPNGLHERTAEEVSKDYKDVGSYSPVQWSEPDGLRKLTPEELSKNYDDLHLYGAVRWNEPNGLRRPTAEEKSKSYKDTHLYAARDVSPPISRVHPEEASKAYKDLPGYRHFANADNTPRVHPEEASKQYTDLNAYASFENDAPQAEQVKAKQYEDLHKYPSAGYEETTRQHVHSEELSKAYTDLGSYRPTEFVSQAQAYPVHPEEASKVYQDLHKYTAVRHNEPNGNMSISLDEVARGLREFDSKAGSQKSPDATSNAYCGTPNRSIPDSMETSVHMDDSGSAETIRAAVLRRAHQNSQRIKNQTGNFEASRTLTGNYARDFPEEFATSWSKSNSSSKSTLLPNNSGGSSGEQISTAIDNEEIASMDESFPIEATRLQPALDRSGKVHKDSYSHEPQGLQTSYSEECGSSTVPVWEKHYEPKPESSKTAKVPKAASYTILAFDPTSKMMNVAQTTSNADDNKTPMSLPAALLLLAEPAKFLPFIQSLQRQGYEVVSGSRQMLVCRQIRPISGGFMNSSVDPFDEMILHGGVFPTIDGETQRSRRGRNSGKKMGLGRKVFVGTVGIAGGAFATASLVEYLSTKGMRPETKQTRQV
ncbi:conserved serine-threonine rich protein [Fusarium langsethiae]|uniref:Conserved serine-threonine rich protein n=1 Tax=Fusarium langsethiae TaxID=179993 RepID=A0A0N0V638_FUSLA|nr:conserved serine-threonine rich protein [Fusarium langsethiae]GKU05041.1 unnamed protein product [Fusarium langsethiae]